MTRVSLRRVGAATGVKTNIPGTMDELLQMATTALNLPSSATRIFFADGDAFVSEDLELVSHDDVLYISCVGEEFIRPGDEKNTSSVAAAATAATDTSEDAPTLVPSSSSSETRGSMPFRATVYEQSYRMHMGIFGTCALLTVNMITAMPTSCLLHVNSSILLMLLATFLGCGAMRYQHHQSAMHAITKTPNASQRRAVLRHNLLYSRTSSHAIVGSFMILSLYCIYVASAATSSRAGAADDDAHALSNDSSSSSSSSGGGSRNGSSSGSIIAISGSGSSNTCDADGMWRDALPLWFAHIGSIELLMGVGCVTLDTSHVFFFTSAGLVHLVFFVANMLIWGVSSTHTLTYAIRCHLAQHASFVAGVYIGDALLHMQRHFYDEASALRIKLLQGRVEQLRCEKERMNYERRMMQRTLSSYQSEHRTHGGSPGAEGGEADQPWADGRVASSLASSESAEEEQLASFNSTKKLPSSPATLSSLSPPSSHISAYALPVASVQRSTPSQPQSQSAADAASGEAMSTPSGECHGAAEQAAPADAPDAAAPDAAAPDAAGSSRYALTPGVRIRSEEHYVPYSSGAPRSLGASTSGWSQLSRAIRSELVTAAATTTDTSTSISGSSNATSVVGMATADAAAMAAAPPASEVAIKSTLNPNAAQWTFQPRTVVPTPAVQGVTVLLNHQGADWAAPGCDDTPTSSDADTTGGLVREEGLGTARPRPSPDGPHARKTSAQLRREKRQRAAQRHTLQLEMALTEMQAQMQQQMLVTPGTPLAQVEEGGLGDRE